MKITPPNYEINAEVVKNSMMGHKQLAYYMIASYRKYFTLRASYYDVLRMQSANHFLSH